MPYQTMILYNKWNSTLKASMASKTFFLADIFYYKAQNSNGEI